MTSPKRPATYTTAKGRTRAELDRRKDYHDQVQAGREERKRQILHSQRIAKDSSSYHPLTELIGAAVAAQLKPKHSRTDEDFQLIERADELYANWRRRRLPKDRLGHCCAQGQSEIRLAT